MRYCMFAKGNGQAAVGGSYTLHSATSNGFTWPQTDVKCPPEPVWNLTADSGHPVRDGVPETASSIL
jgi:hypothetical protein